MLRAFLDSRCSSISSRVTPFDRCPAGVNAELPQIPTTTIATLPGPSLNVVRCGTPSSPIPMLRFRALRIGNGTLRPCTRQRSSTECDWHRHWTAGAVIFQHITDRSGVFVASKTYKQVACFLTPEQHRGLKRLSEETHIPMQVFLRKTVDDVLVRYGVKRKRDSDAFLDRRLLSLRKVAKR
jgi:hypothetical protein